MVWGMKEERSEMTPRILPWETEPRESGIRLQGWAVYKIMSSILDTELGFLRLQGTENLTNRSLNKQNFISSSKGDSRADARAWQWHEGPRLIPYICSHPLEQSPVLRWLLHFNMLLSPKHKTVCERLSEVFSLHFFGQNYILCKSQMNLW